MGVLTFLNELKTNDGSTMLDHVHAISCISGGALTGMTYALSEAEDRSRTETFKQLYKNIVDNNIGDLLLERFDEEAKQGRALIQTLADIYDEIFFRGAKFGSILESMSWEGLHHFFVDATDFDNGLPFRFQATAELQDPQRNEPYGMIGNWRHKISRDQAKKIRLADVMAATSCFPIAFEPIIYPKEFKFEEDERPPEDDLLRYPLMDGGLIDNQGVEPAYHINSHLRDEDLLLNMAIISDAGVEGVEKKWNWDFISITPKRLCQLFMLLGIISLIGFLYFLCIGNMFMSGIFTVLIMVFIFCCWLLRKVDRIICGIIAYATDLSVNKSPIWRNTFKNIITFIAARVRSAFRMTDVVMTGNQKRLWFRALHNDAEWQERIMMNTMNVFSGKQIWKKVLIASELRPTDKMLGAAKIAATMPTTLWFNKEHIEKGMPKAIFAYGRYSICWNLLERINRLKQKDDNELSDFQKWLVEEEANVLDIWNRMKSNHYYNVRRYTDD